MRLFGIMQGERHRMDETRLQNALDELLRLAARSDTRQTALEADVAEIKSTITGMVTKKELAEITHAVTHYGKYVEGMLNAFAKTSLSHEDQIDDLRRRVAALEKRIPPQAA
jgi:Flp pilus assembly protein TadG